MVHSPWSIEKKRLKSLANVIRLSGRFKYSSTYCHYACYQK
jgi:hypothetical protein